MVSCEEHMQSRTVMYSMQDSNPRTKKLTYNGCDVELELLHVPLIEELVCHQLGQLQKEYFKKKANEIVRISPECINTYPRTYLHTGKWGGGGGEPVRRLEAR